MCDPTCIEAGRKGRPGKRGFLPESPGSLGRRPAAEIDAGGYLAGFVRGQIACWIVEDSTS